MAEQEKKTFEVTCAHGQKPFHVRFLLARPDAEGTSEVVVTCMYCDKDVMITLPKQYIETESLVRGLKSTMRYRHPI